MSTTSRRRQGVSSRTESAAWERAKPDGREDTAKDARRERSDQVTADRDTRDRDFVLSELKAAKRGACDVVWIEGAAAHPPREPGEFRIGEERGADEPGIKRHHVDPARSELDGERFGKPRHRKLRRRVDCLIRLSETPRNRRDIHDPALPPRKEVGQRKVQGME